MTVMVSWADSKYFSEYTTISSQNAEFFLPIEHTCICKQAYIFQLRQGGGGHFESLGYNLKEVFSWAYCKQSNNKINCTSADPVKRPQASIIGRESYKISAMHLNGGTTISYFVSLSPTPPPFILFFLSQSAVRLTLDTI